MPGPQRARPAGPEHAYSRSDAKLLYAAHWSILLRGIEGHGEDLDENGCFTERKCVLRCDRYGSRCNFFFENQSLIDFQIGNERKREFRAAEIRFSLHKECRAGEIRFYLHKDFERKLMKISNDLFQKISALRAPIC